MTETKSAPAGSGLHAALAKVQADLPHVGKSKTGEVKKDGKKIYDYDYADLTDVSEAIMPLLGKNGLAFTARPTLNSNGTFVLAYSLLHSSGEREDGEYPLPPNATPQDVGKAITYGRRYCLCAVTGIAPGGDDDDAAGVPAHKMDRGRDESWRDSAPVSRGHREESRPAEHSTDVDDGDWGDFRTGIAAIASQQDADKLDAELRGAFKAQKVGPTKARNIRKAIQAKVASLTTEDAAEYDMVAQKLAGEAAAAASTTALKKVHQAAKTTGKLPVLVKLEGGYQGSLLSFITARRAELEQSAAKNGNGQPAGVPA